MRSVPESASLEKAPEPCTPGVAACDYEDELPNGGGDNNPTAPWIKGVN